MKFAREKRTLLGWMALLAPIPLPLNQVLEWPALFVYAFLVIVYLHRVDSGKPVGLPTWALNGLGLAYLPILLVDLRFALMRDQAVKALMHLILFLVVVKLFSMRREKEKWHVFVAIFFIFVAAMGTSSHLTIFFYLVAALGLGFAVMARFAQLHSAAALGRGKVTTDTSSQLNWVRPSVLLSGLMVIALSVPIFAALPRLDQPLLMGRGGNNLGLSRTTGFSDRVNLNLTSQLRGNREVAMRIQLPEGFSGEDMRFKGASYVYYRNRNWYRGNEQRTLHPDPNGTFQLDPNAPATQKATVYLEPLGSITAILPTQARSVTPGLKLPHLRIDGGGGLLFPGLMPPRQTVQYDVELSAEPYVAAIAPREERLNRGLPGSLDRQGLSPRMEELATQVMGEGSDREKTERLLRHLLNDYSYTTDFFGRDGRTPLEDFLFEYRSGHCEYFASAMVLLLRSENIPARLITGFLGAELNPIEGYYVVRQQNAHAWVEAWIDGRWQIYDPTPPDGRPALATQNLRLLMQQIYDYMAFRWDRYVLTYSSQDQVGAWQKLRSQIADFWARWRDSRDRKVESTLAGADAGVTTPDLTVDPNEAAEPLWQDPKVRYSGLAILLLILAAGVAYMKSRSLQPIDAYERLRQGLNRRGLEVGDSTAPMALLKLVERRHPAVAQDAHTIVDTYIQAGFARRPAPAKRLAELRPALQRVLKGVSRDPQTEA